MVRPPAAAALLLCLVPAFALAQGSYYRTSTGKWEPLPTATAGRLLKFALSPEQVGASGTVLVLSKPKWMVLDDTKAPVAVKLLLDGQDTKGDALALGHVTKAPREFVCAIQDDRNPLDLKAMRVSLDGKPLAAPALRTKPLGPDGKGVRLAVSFGELPSADHELLVTVADRSPARNLLQVRVTFSNAPLVRNGGFEAVMPDGQPVDWQCAAWSATTDTQYEMDVRPGGVGGGKALRIKGIAGGLNLVGVQERGGLRPGGYRMTGSYKSEGGGAVSVYCYDGDTQLSPVLGQPLPAAPDWTPFTWEFDLPAQSKVLIVVRTGSKGETWFDDIKLEPR